MSAVAELVAPDRAAQVREVIALIADGSSENAACIKVGINRHTFRSAVLRVEVVDEYAKAIAALAHDQINRIEDAIEDMRAGTIDSKQARVEIDTRKWFASKMLPRQYGDKQQHEHSGDLTINNADPVMIANQIVARANQFPAQAEMIREWAESILERLPKVIDHA